MSRTLVIRDVAAAEYADAIAFYNLQQSGLGLEFDKEVLKAIQKILDHPERYAKLHKDIRHITVKKFPFSVLYRVRVDRIVIIGVFHHARDPAAWQGRA